jgi:hypothetical protein
MKNIFVIGILAYCIIGILGCSHWTWVYKNEALIREKVCTPDSTHPFIIKDRLVPVLEVDTDMLRLLNDYETMIINFDDSLKTYQASGKTNDSIIKILISSNHQLKNVVYNLRELAKNTKVREITTRVPYPVYIDKQSTLNILIQSQQSGAKKTKAIWILSFIIAGLVAIIVLQLKK